jgi:hypothetical protein
MTAADAAYEVLADAGAALHYRELTNEILSRRLWGSSARDPSASVRAALYRSIRYGEGRFVHVGGGYYDLRARDAQEDPVAFRRIDVIPVGELRGQSALDWAMTALPDSAQVIDRATVAVHAEFPSDRFEYFAPAVAGGDVRTQLFLEVDRSLGDDEAWERLLRVYGRLMEESGARDGDPRRERVLVVLRPQTPAAGSVQ